MFYPVILFITSNSFRQHTNNNKQKHRREEREMRKNGLIPQWMPIKLEPTAKPRYQTEQGAEEFNVDSQVQTRSWRVSNSRSHNQKAQAASCVPHLADNMSLPSLLWYRQPCLPLYWVCRHSPHFLKNNICLQLSSTINMFLPVESQKSGSLTSFHPSFVPFGPSWQNFCQDGWANGYPAYTWPSFQGTIWIGLKSANFFSLVVLSSISLCLLPFYSKQQEETRPHLQHIAWKSPQLSILVHFL